MPYKEVTMVWGGGVLIPTGGVVCGGGNASPSPQKMFQSFSKNSVFRLILMCKMWQQHKRVTTVGLQI